MVPFSNYKKLFLVNEKFILIELITGEKMRIQIEIETGFIKVLLFSNNNQCIDKYVSLTDSNIKFFVNHFMYFNKRSDFSIISYFLN